MDTYIETNGQIDIQMDKQINELADQYHGLAMGLLHAHNPTFNK